MTVAYSGMTQHDYGRRETASDVSKYIDEISHLATRVSQPRMKSRAQTKSIQSMV